MSFTDNFNTLDTTVWDVFNTLPPERNSVSVADGYLRLNTELSAGESGIIGLRKKTTVDLTETKITLVPSFDRASSGVFMKVGLVVTGAPFVERAEEQKGFAYWLMGHGYGDKSVQSWLMFGNNAIRTATLPFIAYPPLLKCEVGEHGIYLFQQNHPLDFKPINFDVKNSIIHVMAAVSTIRADSLVGLVDYIKVEPYDVPETPPSERIGETKEMPLLPLSTLPIILQIIIYPVIGNSLLTVMKPKVK